MSDAAPAKTHLNPGALGDREGLADREGPAHREELADPEAVAHPILTDDYATQWMGLKVLALGDGSATVAATLRREMLNGFGIAHGGMIFAIADSAFALACNPHTPDEDQAGTITVAAGVDVNFLAPAHVGERITAVAARRAQAGRSGLYDVQVFASPQLPASSGDPSSPADPALPGDPAPSGDPASPEDPSSFGAPGRLIAEFRGRSRTIPQR